MQQLEILPWQRTEVLLFFISVFVYSISIKKNLNVFCLVSNKHATQNPTNPVNAANEQPKCLDTEIATVINHSTSIYPIICICDYNN